jgi:hypothetical protein
MKRSVPDSVPGTTTTTGETGRDMTAKAAADTIIVRVGGQDFHTSLETGTEMEVHTVFVPHTNQST